MNSYNKVVMHAAGTVIARFQAQVHVSMRSTQTMCPFIWGRLLKPHQRSSALFAEVAPTTRTAEASFSSAAGELENDVAIDQQQQAIDVAGSISAEMNVDAVAAALMSILSEVLGLQVRQSLFAPFGKATTVLLKAD